jgi:hypothetical protein
MFKQISTQATAFAFAALATLATLGGLQQLATSHDAAQPVADAGAPAQQVVVIGQRQPRG